MYDIETAYAGMLMWDLEHAEQGAARPGPRGPPARRTRSPPRSALLRCRRCPSCRTFLRGRQLVVIDGAVLGRDERGRGAPRRPAGARARDGHLRPGAGRGRWSGCTWTPRAAPGRRPTRDAGPLPDAAVDAFLAPGRPGLRHVAADGRAPPARRRAGSAGRGRRRAAAPRRGVRDLRRWRSRPPRRWARRATPTRSALVEALAPYANGTAVPQLRREPRRRRHGVPGADLGALKGDPQRGGPDRACSRRTTEVPRLYENGLPDASEDRSLGSP